MTFRTVDELRRELARLQLVAPHQLDECARSLSPAAKPEQLLSALESRHLLTSYQVIKLRKGETEGLVLGGYKLMYRNASGSFARVFRVGSIADGTMLGMKVLRQRWAEDPKIVSLFRREAELGRQLKHPNIVPIYEVGSEGHYHYFTMEFIVGGNLRDFINIRKKLSPAEATRYALDMAQGLEYALQKGITHRDLKMTNVLMDTNGTARLIDFGLAGYEGISGSGSGDDVQRALEYSTLEKWTGAPTDDPRSDLFFLGTIYYELLTGTPTYPRTRSREERKDFSRYQNIRPLRAHDPNIPRAVVELTDRLLAVNPDQRIQTPTEACREFRAILDQLGNSSPTSPPTARGSLPRDDKPGANSGPLPTVMCIESRPKQQDILRDYLSRRGFRVLVLSDPERGLERLRTNPPDCMILMGGSMGEAVIRTFQDATSKTYAKPVVYIAVLAERQADRKTDLVQSPTARVLVEPITLRELRREIHVSFQRLLHEDAGHSSAETS